MKDITWLRDYFTDAEILEYKDNILSKYFPKESHISWLEKEIKRLEQEGQVGERKAKSEVQGRERRNVRKVTSSKSTTKKR